MIKFNLQMKHTERLATIMNNKVEQLYQHTDKTYVNVFSVSLNI